MIRSSAGRGAAVNGYLLQIEELGGLIDTLSYGAQRITEANRALRDAEPTDLGKVSTGSERGWPATAEEAVRVARSITFRESTVTRDHPVS
jgi:hypothetical protein